MSRHTQEYYRKQLNFNERFPVSLVAILAIFQMLITFSIIGLEVGHIVYNIRLTNLFVGFWASVPFTILWISMFATVCCCRQRSCATHALVENAISFIFAFVLIGINATFLRRPNDCFFTTTVCDELSSLNYNAEQFGCLLDDTSLACRNTRLTLIKAQLACGVIMAVTCFIYFLIYLLVTLKASKAARQQATTSRNAVMAPVYQQSAPPAMNYAHSPMTGSPYYYQPSAPFMMPAYQPTSGQMSSSVTNMNYMPSNQEMKLYPNIPNDRF